LDPHACSIDDFGPLPVATPQSVAELGDLVRQATADNQALYPIGGRTMLSLGLPPTRPGSAVDVTALHNVIDYPARDMTITLQAGITLARLQDILRTENQRLPVDVPLPQQATLGGALATNASGPRRYGFGTWRDYVIGIQAVNDEGQEFKAGGRVVKNVAGYDLCKLLIGSLGTLGIITQVTLKLKPLPEEQAVILLGCEDAALAELLEQLHRSRTRPVCLDVLNAKAAGEVRERHGLALPEAPWICAVGFEDNRAAVGWQVQQLIHEVSASGSVSLDARMGPAAEPVWRALAEFPLGPEARLTFKANLLPSTVAAFCRQAAALPEAPLLQAHAGNGIVIGHVQADLTLEHARAMLEKLHRWAKPGNIIVPRCPATWKTALPIWGRARGDWWLMREIKNQFDPRRLFNPGRFVDSI